MIQVFSVADRSGSGGGDPDPRLLRDDAGDDEAYGPDNSFEDTVYGKKADRKRGSRGQQRPYPETGEGCRCARSRQRHARRRCADVPGSIRFDPA